MDNKLKKWRDDGKHLPDFLRDFHDQKDFFKYMHEFIDMSENDYASQVDTVIGHTYVIDVFLWMLARHGYTIQKSRADQNFDDLQAGIKESRKNRQQKFANMIMAKKE